MGAHERDGGVEQVDALRRHNAATRVDYAGACGEFIMVEKHRRLIRVDLESDGMVDLASLQIGNDRLRALYRQFHVFPFFK